MKQFWKMFSWLIFHGLRIASRSRVTIVDEGGLTTLTGDTAVLIAANHQSHVDTVALFHYVGCAQRRRLRFVASERRFGARCAGETILQRIERMLLHGLAVHAYDSILVGNDNSNLRAVESIASAIRNGDSVVVYPEGTRSITGKLGLLRPGVAMVCASQQVSIVPIRIDGTFKSLPKNAHIPRFGVHIRLCIRPAIIPQPFEAPSSILARLRPSLEESIHE